MQVKVLGVDQYEEWHKYLTQLPEADIYFTPEYCRIYEENGEGLAQLFVFYRENKFICYPFLLRKINLDPRISSQLDTDLYDITTPYGYGGPLSNITDEDEKRHAFENFGSIFHEYCIENNIITEFVRFHPMLKNNVDYRAVNPTFVRNTIYIDLRCSVEEIWERFSKNNRNRIRRSQRENLMIKHTDRGGIDNFTKLYYSTMEKKQANDYYYFSPQFIMNTLTFLKGSIELIEVQCGNQVIASSLFMYYNDFVHYHLMGSDKQFLSACPVNFLIHYAVLWAKEKGFKFLHLGGGYEGDDNLLRFKKGFNTGEPADFYIGRKIHCNYTYNMLLNKLQCKSQEQEDYFPAYRLS
ncbi:lipid II:glycine glycyltransferase FemX [Paenibacillus terrigena]|uniref:lipid II:glycine glycyltransferase FemX n=1 Tax=Paenibacillus terrigena TaxID=369333 RepID=UPI00035C3305|nr:peptidoglycan bridge formation glycyltransferase FemA/FemB family protein [Paenibacillus terrigena]